MGRTIQGVVGSRVTLAPGWSRLSALSLWKQRRGLAAVLGFRVFRVLAFQGLKVWREIWNWAFGSNIRHD